MTDQRPQKSPAPTTAKPWTPEASTLAAKVAHELNNPLDAVLRYVTLAQRKVKTHDYNDVERYLSDAQFGLQRMAEILRDLIDLGRQTNALLEKPRPLPVPMIVNRSVRVLTALAQTRGILIDLRGEIDDQILLDPRLVQVLTNLLKNAIEATPDHTPVTLEARHDAAADRVIFIITDVGPGVSEDKLFQPFVSGKDSAANAGLGLVICRELLAGIGGTLSLENRAAPNHGCIATVIVPVNHA